MRLVFRRKPKPYGRYAKRPDFWEGRVASLGDGHVVADEGPRRGEYVKWIFTDDENGVWVFVREGENSHYDDWHQAHTDVAIEA